MPVLSHSWEFFSVSYDIKYGLLLMDGGNEVSMVSCDNLLRLKMKTTVIEMTVVYTYTHT